LAGKQSKEKKYSVCCGVLQLDHDNIYDTTIFYKLLIQYSRTRLEEITIKACPDELSKDLKIRASGKIGRQAGAEY
jgi:hypothetical protein